MLKSPFLSKIRKRRNTKVKGDRAPYPATQQRKVAGTHSLTMHHSPSALPRVSLDEAFLQTYILWTKVPLHQKRCCTAVYGKTAGHHSACQGSGPASTVLTGQGSATPSAVSVTTFACSNRHDVVRNASLFRTTSHLKVELHKTDRANGRRGPLDSLLRLSSVVALPSESLKNEKEGVAES